jgi:hypothetical protein
MRMRQLLILFILVISAIRLAGQGSDGPISGQISFLSSKNIYVKFTSTKGISSGDTLFISADGKLMPALIVNNLSSTSCVCTALTTRSLSVGDAVVVRKTPLPESVGRKEEQQPIAAAPVIADTVSFRKEPASETPKQQIRGSLSAYSYSDFSNTGADASQRFRYTLSLNARNISDSKFSLDSYLSFRHKLGEWNDVSSNVFNALKIYSLALSYSPDKSSVISIGRKINNNIASMGAMDGLQAQKSFGKFTLGALAGFRPDYENYGFNAKLFQYGGYAAFSAGNKGPVNETSVAFMQQMNGSKTDRRFMYFQHSNTLIKNFYFLGTLEVDMYQLAIDSSGNETKSSKLSATGLYLSGRYRLSKKLSISGSYDARKNVMYYESYKSYIDRLIDNEMRQGFRVYANMSLTRDLSFGLQGGYRFMKSDPRPSKNAYGYFTYNQIPGINVTATLSGTYIESGYLNGIIGGINLTREFFEGKLQTGLGYRYIHNEIPENLTTIVQQMGEANLTWLFYKKMSLSINYEGTMESAVRYNMLYVQVRKRF